MGEVYKARDTRLNRIVAIKSLKGHHTARFEQEARAIAALNHPYICQIYDVGADYLVMEFVEGEPLRGPLRVEEAVTLARQIVAALAEAHAKGILHRDLKPSNILVTTKGAAKLLDFGLAKLMTKSETDVTMTTEGTILGTAAYMAPWNARVAGVLAAILTRTGERDRAAELRRELKDAAPIGMVVYHILCSELDAAADWYEKCIEQREPFAVMYARTAIAAPLRSSARWPALAKSMNLP
jgi:serine/threonine protein kinase